MTDTLEIFGDTFTGVAGIKAEDGNSNTLTYIRPQGTISISANGSGIDVSQYASADVSVTAPSPSLQTKSVSYTPSESSQSGTVTPDTGYDGLSSVSVSVGAISSDYVGSNITRRSSSDMTAAGATVTAPAGYYDSAASKTLQSMTKAVSNTSAGSLWNSVNATSSIQYVNFSEGYNSQAQHVRIWATAGSAGTPTASKGAVSNHSIAVTPSVTNTTGYITGSTKTGTAVTVTASELDSGTKSITQNGTGIDVVGYAAVDVSVSGGVDMPTFTVDSTMTSVTCDKTFAECVEYINNDVGTALISTPYGISTAFNVAGSGTQLTYVVSDPVPEVDIVYNSDGTINLVSPSTYRETLSVTQNGTYYPSRQNKAIMEVTVNVPSSQPTLQTKTKTYTPSTSQQTESVTADNGYDGLSAVNVTVNAMPAMTLPSAASASSTGTEQAVIRPSANNQYINIPTGYNGAAKFYELAPMMLGTKSITANGTYLAGDDDLHGFSSVTVSVSGGSSEVAVSSANAQGGGSDLTFYNLLGEPTSFVIFCAESTLATGGTPYKTAAVVYDGANDKVQYITNTSNAQMTYQAPSAYHFYNNGQLVVTCMDSQFVSGQYGIYYTYGGGAGNIGTSLVQVGSGATSIQFTNLPDEPIYWSCIFTGNIGTSSGYTRAHVVASDGDYIVGREMGSGSTFSNEHWTASYSNGTLTITSQSTSAGGYFHQPGYYQLTYAVAGDGQITTEPLNVIQNGTYTAPFGTAYTPVTVNVPSGGANTDTKTTTNSDDQATTLQFTGMKGEPIAFFLRCTSQLSRSSSYSYYYITAMRHNGTNTTGNYWRRSNGTFYNDTSHYSFTYSGTTLTLSSSASRGAAGGSFYNGGYELVYVY